MFISKKSSAPMYQRVFIRAVTQEIMIQFLCSQRTNRLPNRLQYLLLACLSFYTGAIQTKLRNHIFHCHIAGQIP